MQRQVLSSTFTCLRSSGYVSTATVEARSPGGTVYGYDAILRGTTDPGDWTSAASGIAIGGGLPPVTLITLPATYPLPTDEP